MFEVREAIDEEYEFLFELKKAAEYEPVKAIFGWDENVQKEIHRNEWNEAKPTIIEIDGDPAGSYLVQNHPDHLYFGRFFLLPHYQGKGIGSQVLKTVIQLANEKSLPIQLCYLQGNRVGQLYKRFGFEVTRQDEQFVHMLKPRL
ncbi:TPA: GNAT family N-acetyltransferase [Vibrio parahaemolyticus]|uniref:GNAT family N-acetyltransferase n=1 Tax=Vibrio harveyi group TaxID=717610 RepID=UPI0003FB3E64|nr:MULTISPECIES: GNAT family N-acetyltransferase [Vibrio harveyi group]ELA9866664.1 GNAT family N-acetyltransferase [Vibrio parahaemolyticus]ELI5382460.1 GNAT family N-acetyltransferase [Vibrio parahaemolyticus]MBM5178998.1 GNAT family N-acetyltransferase [Vibrio parahaemolyticus]MBM5196180.1 GNAT family N-acetyltransferase [Vibrio parahaemolyticus]QIR92986.1 GNAT family N-acetyltransferase [Vibrio alginolyticus]